MKCCMGGVKELFKKQYFDKVKSALGQVQRIWGGMVYLKSK